MKRIPEWMSNHSELVINENWTDTIINEYPYSFVTQTGEEYSPLNHLEKDVLMEDTDYAEILAEITIPKPYTLSQTMKFVYDLYKCFFNNIPKQDSQLYQIYKNIEESNNFTVDFEFDCFYKYCRRYQYLNFEESPNYKSISKIVRENTYDEFPSIGSKWKIEEDQDEICVNITDIDKSYPRFIDSNAKCEIIKTDSSIYDKNEVIDVTPKQINNGNRMDDDIL